MWFKNIIFYRLSESFTLSPEVFHDKLYDDSARPCGKMEKVTLGWVPPLGKTAEMLVYPLNGCYLIAAKKEEKLLPTTVIREHVQEKIEKIEREEARAVSAREKRSLMDEMSITLLPQAFSKSSITYAYIDTKNHWLIINTASVTKAEELTVLLRKSLGSLKLLAPECKQSPSACMTLWVKERTMPKHFCIEDYCEMINPHAEKTVIKCVNQDLFAHEVNGHLTSGKQIVKLGMSWQDRVGFVIDPSLSLKRIQFLDLVQETIVATEAETYEAQFEADFAIFSGEFASLLEDISDLFGGFVDASSKVVPEKVMVEN